MTTITFKHCLSLLLRVLVVLGLNATLKFIRPSMQITVVFLSRTFWPVWGAFWVDVANPQFRPTGNG